MSINFNVKGSERKALAGAVGEYLGLEAVYNGAPTFSYTIGVYTIDRSGVLSYPEHCSDEMAKRLVISLKEQGYNGEFDATSDSQDIPMTEREELGLGRERRDQPGEDGMRQSDVPESDTDDSRLVIEIPREGFSDAALDNLKKIISSKDTLIKKALNVYDLPFTDDYLKVEITEDKLCFPWFSLRGIDGEADAYSRFVTALCEMAKTQKRVTAKEQPLENDKFAMRIFLVRLGLKGPDNKVVRSIMLKHLSGNSSWKSGKPEKKADEESGNAEASAPENKPAGTEEPADTEPIPEADTLPKPEDSPEEVEPDEEQ